MFRPNTVAIPVDLVEQAARGNVSPEIVLYAAYFVMGQEEKGVNKGLMDRVRAFYTGAEGNERPSNGAYPDPPIDLAQAKLRRNDGKPVNVPEPNLGVSADLEEFGPWLYNEIMERFPHKTWPPKDEAIETIFTMTNGDRDLAMAALVVVEDQDKNKKEIRVPATIVIKTLEQYEEQNDMDKLKRRAGFIINGHVGGNSVAAPSRVTRALQKTQEEIQKNPRPVVRDDRFTAALADDAPEGVDEDDHTE